jgi:phosphonate degradation associated HDIG domain protein
MTETNADAIIDEILAAFAASGHLDYGEHISMQEHMLQAACLADRKGEDDAVVVATLLHDYGHLVCNMPNNTFEAGIDNYHEEVGAKALENWFGDDIVGAVRLHVDAKRYLCAATPAYRDKLSQASITTLEVQGGPMNDAEMEAFREQPGHRLALKVRVYDDLGKEPQMERPELDHYVPKLRACISC